jgi:hypothetical protein
MANVSGQATLWNLPNYAGELITASPERTPFLSMIGGMGGGVQSSTTEFAVNSQYTHEDASQPNITETDSLTAPTAIEYAREQVTNTTQIFMEAIQISYVKLSNSGTMTGLNMANVSNPVQDEKAFQISTALKKMARDIEYTFLQGTYQQATDAGTAAKTRGMLAATTTASINGASATLTKSMVDQCVKAMADGGAQFGNMVVFVNSFQKQKLSDIYGFAPADRNIGGLNVQTIYTDFCQMGVVFDPFMPAASILIADVSACRPVFQPVPGKGNFFYEELSKTGAGEYGQLFGQIGLDYGAEWLHGEIYGLATS